MRSAIMLRLFTLVSAAAVASCASDAAIDAPDHALAARRDAAPAEGAVYTMTNGAAGNAIVAFHRAADGTLSALATYATGGTGTGAGIDPLVSQYSIVISDDEQRVLYAVNAGSNEITSFRVADDGALTLADRAPSGGVRPVSLALHHRLLYVLNSADGALRGYRAAASGEIVALPGATPSIGANAGGAAIRFTTDGRFLVAVERAANRIDVFPVAPDGRLGAPTVTSSHGASAFGFDVTPANDVVVSETAANAPVAGGVSSYRLRDGSLDLRTASESSGGRAACWLINTADGRFSYVVNAATATVGEFSIGADGTLSSIGVTPAGGSAALDPAFSSGDRFLYVLQAGTGAIAGFARGADGSLAPVGTATAGAGASGLQGLAAF